MKLKIFKGYERFKRRYPSKEVKYALEHREEAVPELLEIMEYTLDNIKRLTNDPEYLIHIPAIHLLACFRETKAYEYMIRISSLKSDRLFNLFGSIVEGSFRNHLASVCDGNIEPIKKIIEDSSLDEFIRSDALESLVILMSQGMVTREQLVSYIKELLNGKLKVDKSHIWMMISRTCISIHPDGLVEDINKAIADGKILKTDVDFKEMERQMKKTINDVLDELKQNKYYSVITEEDILSLEKWVGNFDDDGFYDKVYKEIDELYETRGKKLAELFMEKHEDKKDA